MILLPGGGAALPVSVTTTRKVQGGAAIPVYGYMTAPTDGRPALGGSAIPVRVLTAADLKQNGGQWTLEGRPYAMPVYTAPATTTVLGGPALAVYPVNAWPTVLVVPAWVPTDITGLKLWLKADTGLYKDGAKAQPVTADADAVYTWADQSGNGRDVVQATAANRPLYKVNIQNGKPVVRFDGAGDVMTRVVDYDAISGADAVTIFIVQMQLGSIANSSSFRWNAISTNWINIYATFSDLIIFDFPNVTTGRISIAQPAGWDDAYKVLTFRRNAATASIIRVNGSTIKTGTQAGTLSSVPTANIYIGVDNFGGDFCELLIYNSSLSDADVTNVETYLNTRWAVY